MSVEVFLTKIFFFVQYDMESITMNPVNDLQLTNYIIGSTNTTSQTTICEPSSIQIIYVRTMLIPHIFTWGIKVRAIIDMRSSVTSPASFTSQMTDTTYWIGFMMILIMTDERALVSQRLIFVQLG